MIRKFLLATIGAAMLLGCADVPSPKTPAQAVFEAKTGYAVALAIAVQYRNLPTCGAPTNPPLCSDPATVAKIRAADAVAAPALDAAEASVRNPDFSQSAIKDALIVATNAVTALTAITSTLRVK